MDKLEDKKMLKDVLAASFVFPGRCFLEERQNSPFEKK